MRCEGREAEGRERAQVKQESVVQELRKEKEKEKYIEEREADWPARRQGQKTRQQDPASLPVSDHLLEATPAEQSILFAGEASHFTEEFINKWRALTLLTCNLPDRI